MFISNNRTEDTNQKYRNRVYFLSRQAMKQLNVTEIDARQLVMWFLDKRTEYSRNTFRQYKAALMFTLNEANDVASIEAVEYLAHCYDVLSLQKGRFSSSNKAKYITDEQLDKIEKYFTEREENGISYARETLIFLLSGLLTGLRPVEWCQAEIIVCPLENSDKKVLTLKVKNAKSTNKRSNGEYRFINIQHLNEEQISLLREQITLVQSAYHADAYKLYYENCKTSMTEMNKVIFPERKKKITLYSARHQFSANIKNDLSNEEIAAVMGHASEHTAWIFYGKKRYGKSSLKIKPIINPKLEKTAVSKVEHTVLHSKLGRKIIDH